MAAAMRDRTLDRSLVPVRKSIYRDFPIVSKEALCR